MTDQNTDTAQSVSRDDQLRAAADQARAYGLEQVALAFELDVTPDSPTDSESTAHTSAD